MYVLVDAKLPEWVLDAARKYGTVKLFIHARDVLPRGPTIAVFGTLNKGLLKEVRAMAASMDVNPTLLYPVPVGHLMGHPDAEPAVNALLAFSSSWARDVARFLPKMKAVIVPPRGRVSRRELLSPKSWVKYPESPITVGGCSDALANACRRCVSVCREKAIDISDSGPSVRTLTCVECGLCAAVCPIGSLQVPVFSDQVVGSLSLLSPPPERAASWVLVFTCDRGIEEVSNLKLGKNAPLLLPVRVPCVASIGYYALLAGLNAGLDALFLFCPGDDCVREWAVNSMSYVVDAAAAISARYDVKVALVRGDERALLSLARGAGTSRARERRAALMLDRRRDTLALLSAYAREGDALPGLLYDVEVGEQCTMCGVCADRCPTGSLKLRHSDDAVRLFFDARMCIGCGACEGSCPEHAIRVREHTYSSYLLSAMTKRKDEIVKCKVCGAPLGPKSMIDRVAEKLREKGLDKLAERAYLCSTCKLLKSLSPVHTAGKAGES